jgi:putative hydrolase of HD superfamily
MDEQAKEIIPFFQFILQLKCVKRSGWASKVKISNPESVADHTYSMCAMSMVLSDMLGLDTERIMKMVLLHDLVESVTGDYLPQEISKKQKRKEEDKVMKSILCNIPSNVRSHYKKIWKEYILNKTEIAHFVHRTDKLEMALQAKRYAKEYTKDNGHSNDSFNQFFDSANESIRLNKPDLITNILKNVISTL